VVELSTPLALLMVFRSRVGSIFQSRSADGGRTWGEASVLGGVGGGGPGLPNPNSKIDLIRLNLGEGGAGGGLRGRLALVFNDHRKQSRAALAGRGLHSFRFQLNLSCSVYRVTQLNS